jgi:hypothetical protein
MADSDRLSLEKTIQALTDARANVDRLIVQCTWYDAENDRVKISEEGRRALSKVAEARVAVDHAMSAIREAYAIALNIRPS